MKYYNSDLPIRLRMTAHRYLLLENNSLLFLAESWERRWLIFFTSSLTLHFIFSIGEKRLSWNLRSINTYNVTFLFVGIFFQQTAFIINFRRCLNVTRKADWTFLNNLATFGGFLFSYFHRFTIGIQTRVIIAGSFTSQVAVTSLHQIQHQNTKNTKYNIVLA